MDEERYEPGSIFRDSICIKYTLRCRYERPPLEKMLNAHRLRSHPAATARTAPAAFGAPSACAVPPAVAVALPTTTVNGLP
jgi:hypothetical protein